MRNTAINRAHIYHVPLTKNVFEGEAELLELINRAKTGNGYIELWRVRFIDNPDYAVKRYIIKSLQEIDIMPMKDRKEKTQAVKRYNERMKSEGFIQIHPYILAEDKERIFKYIKRLRKQRGKQL